MSRADDIARWCGLFVPPGQITELRALRVGGSETWSGYFDGADLAALARAALDLEARTGAIYFLPNPVRPAKLKLGAVEAVKKGEATTDEMIAARRWLLVDVDPTRLGADAKPLADSGCPATDGERAAAWRVLERCRGALAAFGLAGEIVGDSGNGYHLSYPIDLPNDDAARALHRAVLTALAARSGDAGASVDVKTFNAARIWKLYGTQARKGAADAARRWRYSQAFPPKAAGDARANTVALKRAVETWAKQDAARHPQGDPGAYGRKALELEVGKVATAAPGTRNNVLNAAAFALGQLVAGGELARDVVEAALLATATGAAKLPHAEAVHTIRNGIEAGAKEPRKAPEGAAPKATAAPPQLPSPPVPVQADPISCADLMAQDLPEPRYAVAGFLPEGVTILAGRPKARKSWLALQLALGVAQGARVLGTIDTAPGDVLYLALEDTRRRLKKRVAKILTATGWTAPGRLEFRTIAERMPAGAAAIEEWIKKNPGARMVIVDTLQKVRPPQKGGQKDGYADDYGAVGDLKAVADRYAVAILVLHHSRKASADSPFDEISGTLGLTAAADGMFLLQRDHDADTAALYVTGRDLEEETLQLGWDDAGCLWSITSREGGINRPAPDPDGRKATKAPRLVECAQWLMRGLSKGPMRWSAMKTESDANGFNDKLLSRALKECHAVRYEDEQRGAWYRLLD